MSSGEEVGEGGTATVRADVLQEVVHYRVGGHAGVRVTTTSVNGASAVKRVNGANDEPTSVPLSLASRDMMLEIIALTLNQRISVDADNALNAIAALIPR